MAPRFQLKKILLSLMFLQSILFAESGISEKINDDLSIFFGGMKPAPVQSVTYSPDGKYFSAILKNGSTSVWSSSKGTLVKTLPAGSSDFNTYVDVDSVRPDSAIIQELQNAFSISKYHNGKITCACISYDNTKAATGCSDGFIRIFDMTGKVLQSMEVYNSAVTTVKFSSSGKSLVTGDVAGIITIYDVRTGALKSIHQGPGKTIKSMSFSPDGKYLIAADSSGLIGMWNFQTEEYLLTLAQNSAGAWISWNTSGYVDGSEGILSRAKVNFYNQTYSFQQVQTVVQRPDFLEKTISTNPALSEITSEKLSAAAEKVAAAAVSTQPSPEKSPAESKTSYSTLGIYFNEDFPMSAEGEFILTKLGIGGSFEHKTSSAIGFSGTAQLNFGVKNVDFINSWTIFSADCGIFANVELSEAVAIQPELHSGFNFNYIVVDLDGEKANASYTDFFLSPAVALRWNVSEHNSIDTAISYKCTFEKSASLNSFGYRLGFFHKFN